MAVDLPRFDVGETEGGGVMRRGVPTMRVGGQLVTTVFDLLLAQYGVVRPGLPGEWPAGYDDGEQPYTPAWQEEITSVDRHQAARVAREFARNAELTEGRSMICMGAGTNHWFHSDQTYRTFLSLLMLCGCEGRNGGGWAHYVGQEKVRPLTGLADARVRARLDASAAPPVGDAVLLPRLRSVALRAHPPRGPRLAPRPWAAEGSPHRRHQRARRAAGLAAVVSEL